MVVIAAESCAYCGNPANKSTKGHVLSRSIYPESIANALRITVPECTDCKKLWEDAEPQFRNILVTIWNPNSLPDDLRSEKMMRSFDKVDGKKRATDILTKIVDTKDGDKIYPLDDERFYLILRRIVRGLSHYHNVETRINDSCVECDVARYEIPPAFQKLMKLHIISKGFFEYEYAPIFENGINSFWTLKFSDNIKFYGIVKSNISGKIA